MAETGLNDLLALSNQLNSTGVAGAQGSEGIRGLMQRPSGTGADFLGFARGQQMARDVSWQDRLRGLQQERMGDEMTLRGDARLDRQQRQSAARLLQGMNRRRQIAADANVDPIQFLEGERDALINSREFQMMDPRTQDLALQNLQRTVNQQVGELAKINDMEGANRLRRAFGHSDYVSAIQQAAYNNDREEAVRQLNLYSGDDNFAEALPDGNIRVGDRVYPIEIAMATLLRYGGVPGSVNRFGGEWALQQRMQQQLAGQPSPGVRGSGSSAGILQEPDWEEYTDLPTEPPAEPTPAIRPDGLAPNWREFLAEHQGVSFRGLNEAEGFNIGSEALFQLVNRLGDDAELDSMLQSNPRMLNELLTLIESDVPGAFPQEVRYGGASTAPRGFLGTLFGGPPEVLYPHAPSAELEPSANISRLMDTVSRIRQRIDHPETRLSPYEEQLRRLRGN